MAIVKANIEINVEQILRELSADDLARVTLVALDQCAARFDREAFALRGPAREATNTKARRLLDARRALTETIREVFK